MKISQLVPLLKITTVEEKANYGRFVIEPLPTGYGHTLGNALRRVLLSSLPGAAVTQFRIEGAPHQFSTLPGIKEDVVQLSLNFKKIRLKIYNDNPVALKLEVKGPREVRAGELEVLGDAEVVNKDLLLATLAEGKTKFSLELTAEKGVGYVPAEERPTGKIGAVALDSIFTPITAALYSVEPTRVGRETNLDRLVLEISCDGTLPPSEALAKAATILMDYFKIISGEKVVFETPVEEKKEEFTGSGPALSEVEKKIPVEDLGLSTRTTNALLAGKIKILGELVNQRPEDLAKLRGFGQKAVSEVDKLLSKQSWR